MLFFESQNHMTKLLLLILQVILLYKVLLQNHRRGRKLGFQRGALSDHTPMVVSGSILDADNGRRKCDYRDNRY